MKRGLVIGKFMPVHNGHLALIEFAKQRCDELIVSLSYTPQDPIKGETRFEWLKKIYATTPDILIEKVLDDFDDESLPLTERTALWANFIARRYPKIDILISSESYGEPFANHLGATNLVFDGERKKFPVSATAIRSKPFANWEFIPEVVRPYFVKKVCFYGPESTGKSTMAERMAKFYRTEFVPEVARELITSNEFTLEDIERIGEAQTNRVEEKQKKANKILFCDTDLITTQIYSTYYLGKYPSVLAELEDKIHYDGYFFFEPDVPWVEDGLRDLGNKRDEMTNLFRKELERRRITYVTVKGDWENRFQIIKSEIDKLLEN